MNQTLRQVFCEDALLWLKSHTPQRHHAMVSSMPDFSEFPHLTIVEWKRWFSDTAALIMAACHPDDVSIFFQSDIKHEGTWIDKAYLVQRAAEAMGQELLFHKIVARAPVGTPTFGRPGYSHVLAFSSRLKLHDLQKSTTDIIADNGQKTWARGMGFKTCMMVAKFAKEHTNAHTIVNPFCGEGSMLAAANHVGLSAIGIERSTKRARHARGQMVNAEENGWRVVTND